MGKRSAEIQRKTKETQIVVRLNLDGDATGSVRTGIGFFDHMLESFARHSGFDLSVEASGDLHVDAHHTVEDVGICLGKAFKEALGDKAGITRFGDAAVPMDEALVMVAADLSGRGVLVADLHVKQENIGGFPSHLLIEFLKALAYNAGITLHARQFAGDNPHHIVESVFKSLARALKQATARAEGADGVPSTKGVL